MDCFVEFVVLKRANVAVQCPFQHVDGARDLPVVGHDGAAMEMDVTDLIGEFSPRSLSEPLESFTPDAK